jgi:hypothetical protein
MATTTIGSNLATNDWLWNGTMQVMYVNNNYNISGLGRMIDTNVFAGRVNAGGSGGARAWKNGSIVIDQTGEGFTLGNTSAGNSAQADASCSWHTTTGDVPTTSSDNWLFGGNNSSGLYAPYHDGSPDTWDASNGQGFVSKSPFFRSGNIHAYGTYFILALYERVGAGWVQKFWHKKGAGGSTTTPKVFKKTAGGGNTQVGHLAADIAFDPVGEYPAMLENDNGILVPGLLRWEGPYYLGNKPEIIMPRVYELVAA